VPERPVGRERANVSFDNFLCDNVHSTANSRMKISEGKAEEFPPKLGPLVEAFRLSPFRVAPERREELTELLDKHGVEIYPKPDVRDWMFEEWRMGKKIFVGTRTLERLWAYCYGYTAIITELQKAGGVFKFITNSAEYKHGFHLLKWAKQETLADREGEWPETLPDPSHANRLEHVKTATDIFLTTSGRLLLHEFAHAVCNHSTAPDTPSETKKKEELAADVWADSWMLDKWKHFNRDEKVFIRRCMGIAFAHAPNLILGIDKEEVSESHPDPIERILSFIDRWVPNGKPSDNRPTDRPCAFLLVIAGHLLWEKQKPFEWDPLPDTYRELFMRFDTYFR
jgi:hypothetical protein